MSAFKNIAITTSHIGSFYLWNEGENRKFLVYESIGKLDKFCKVYYTMLPSM